jgi:hypothetical protein
MSVTIDYDQICSIEAGPLYRVRTTVSYVSGINAAIFVFNTELGTFQYVATVFDMEQVTADHALAVSEGRAYYRASSCDVSYDNQDDALEFVEYTAGRIQSLATDYFKATSEFEGTVHEHVVS